MRRTLRSPGFTLLVLLLAASLLAGVGLRDPHPADEPRFVLVADHMVESGDWLFPRRGTELYADKPPVFMWLLAGAQRITGDWRTSFLLPSWIAALLALWLTQDLARRLWNPTAGRHALLALFACLQFGLQARRAQIDMVLLAMMMLSLWSLAQYVLQRRDPRLLALGAFAAGLGTVTKGVGFLPLLVLPALPWLATRRPWPASRSHHPVQHVAAGVAGFLAGAGLWLVPMLAAVLGSDDPQLRAYAADILWKQTGTRYADPWHHLKPAWYYLQVMATLWLPGTLLLPWLLPAWWRRLRRGDPRWRLLLGWAALVLLFFSLSPAKRDVYVLPVLPVLAIAAAPLLPGLLRRRDVRLTLAAWLATVAIVALAAGLAAWPEPVAWWQRIGARHEAGPEVLAAIGRWLLVLGAWTAGCLAWAAASRLRRVGVATLLAMAGLWTIHGVGLMPAVDAGSSARALMQQVDTRIGPDAELGLLAWREQHLLQAGRDVAVFGFNRPWPAQWRDAAAWLAAAPGRRWLFVLEDALDPCVDRARAARIGVSNRRTWWLVPASAMVPGCMVGTTGDGNERRANARAMPADVADD
ncbi:glycosyltransferase family 39 protein [Luteimonas viscosa]|uniref:Glycosyltransferase family 39 protein n=1 Tax=Luteimonas viscosa TaxID=1132694 RepID=A0A5D4XP12_9GAMM|nr:glycosyltransferase family 39 protein [Luteimonas viscosa]TYT25521.1 glycosyltransferase family 39 protein [Luteimonas viscosa]